MTKQNDWSPVQALRNSWIGEALHIPDSSVRNASSVRVLRSLLRSAENSQLHKTVQASAETVRSSYLYGWFTAESDIGVVVIDLRETRTIGLLFAVLERIVGELSQYWSDAVFRTMVTRIEAHIRDSTAVSALAKVLEPVERPQTDRVNPPDGNRE